MGPCGLFIVCYYCLVLFILQFLSTTSTFHSTWWPEPEPVRTNGGHPLVGSLTISDQCAEHHIVTVNTSLLMLSGIDTLRSICRFVEVFESISEYVRVNPSSLGTHMMKTISHDRFVGCSLGSVPWNRCETPRPAQQVPVQPRLLGLSHRAWTLLRPQVASAAQ